MRQIPRIKRVISFRYALPWRISYVTKRFVMNVNGYCRDGALYFGPVLDVPQNCYQVLVWAEGKKCYKVIEKEVNCIFFYISSLGDFWTCTEISWRVATELVNCVGQLSYNLKNLPCRSKFEMIRKYHKCMKRNIWGQQEPSRTSL